MEGQAVNVNGQQEAQAKLEALRKASERAIAKWDKWEAMAEEMEALRAAIEASR